MIKDNIINIHRYPLNNFFENFKQTLLNNQETYPLELDAPMKAISLEYETNNFDLTKFESHRKFIDVHFIIEGAERIAINKTNNLKKNTPYDEEGDYELFDGKIEEVIIMEKGDFLVLFPGEAHTTSGKHRNHEFVKKNVYKIPLNNF